MVKPTDMTGETFGKLTVMERGESDRHGKAQWWCQCECGRRKLVRALNLNQGDSRSCGECGAYHQTGLDANAIRFEITVWSGARQKIASPVSWGQVIDAETRELVFRSTGPRNRNVEKNEIHACITRCMSALAAQGLIEKQNMRTHKRWCVEERVAIDVKDMGNDEAVWDAWYEVTGEPRPVVTASRAQQAQRIELPYPSISHGEMCAVLGIDPED